MEMQREPGSVSVKQNLVQNIAVGTPVEGVDIEGGKRCRNCGSNDNQAELIAPCLCEGERHYIHRKCLDRERVYSSAPNSFTECNTCHYEYWITKKNPESTKSNKCCECKRASLLIARDSIGGIITIQLMLMALAWMIAILDNGFTRIVPADCCPQAQYNFYTWDTGNTQCPGLCGTRDAQGGRLLNSMPRWIAQHTKTAYFLMAVFVVWFVFATIGVFKLLTMSEAERERNVGGGFAALFCCCFCTQCCKEDESNRDFMNYHSFGSSNTNCNCSSSSCNGNGCSGGGGEAIAIVAVVIMALFLAFIFLSFFMGFLIIMGLISKLIQNHFTLLKRKEFVKEFIVMDCHGIEIAPDANGRAPLPPDYDSKSLSQYNIR